MRSNQTISTTTFAYGRKHYELSNHLGNVLSTVSDAKLAVDADDDGFTDYFEAVVKTQQDYYPFGMIQPERSYTFSINIANFNPGEDCVPCAEIRTTIAEYYQTNGQLNDPAFTNYLQNTFAGLNFTGVAFMELCSLELVNSMIVWQEGADLQAFLCPDGVYEPDVITFTDDYRYGFNGKENDNEVIGKGRWQDYGMRMYRPDLGRFFSPDPIIVYGKKFPELSTYQFASNTPIQAIDLDGLEAFFVHGTTQSKNTFSTTAKSELQRIAGNTASDESFKWYSPLLNDMPLRNIAARKLAKHVVKTRSQMMKDDVITKDEHVSLVGYSHGGNVSIQAARILNKNYGIKVNLLTVSTPAYNSSFNVDSDNIFFGDPEDPQGNPGINQHIQVVHEKDKVVYIAGGSKTYSNPDNTTNYMITQDEVPLSGGIESHTDLPGSKEFGDYLKNIPQMKKAPLPTKLDEK